MKRFVIVIRLGVAANMAVTSARIARSSRSVAATLDASFFERGTLQFKN